MYYFPDTLKCGVFYISLDFLNGHQFPHMSIRVLTSHDKSRTCLHNATFKHLPPTPEGEKFEIYSGGKGGWDPF
jgi:hypothetical protein